MNEKTKSPQLKRYQELVEAYAIVSAFGQHLGAYEHSMNQWAPPKIRSKLTDAFIALGDVEEWLTETIEAHDHFGIALLKEPPTDG